MARAYTFKLLLAATLVALGTALVNLVIDPYGIWGVPAIPGINDSKHMGPNNYRYNRYATFARWKAPPQTIMLGSSKTEGGLRADHPALRDGVTYNMALGGQPIREALLLFRHALKGGQLRRAVIGLDFFVFNAYWATDLDFSARLQDGPNLDLLFSTSVLSDSVATFRKSWHFNSPTSEPISEAHVEESGALPTRQWFAAVEAGFLPFYIPAPYRQYAHTNPHTGEDTLAVFRELLDLAHANGVEVHLFISPSHAWHWEALAGMGLWENWEQWKRALARINREAAVAANQPVFPLLDFSGYNGVTTEQVPAPNAPDRMKWYNDPAHYNTDCGDLVLDRLFGLSDAAGFGVALDASNIDTHLAEIRQERKRYEATHAADAGEMAALVKQVMGH